jgi:hypothetical protein
LSDQAAYPCLSRPRTNDHVGLHFTVQCQFDMHAFCQRCIGGNTNQILQCDHSSRRSTSCVTALCSMACKTRISSWYARLQYQKCNIVPNQRTSKGHAKRLLLSAKFTPAYANCTHARLNLQWCTAGQRSQLKDSILAVYGTPILDACTYLGTQV